MNSASDNGLEGGRVLGGRNELETPAPSLAANVKCAEVTALSFKPICPLCRFDPIASFEQSRGEAAVFRVAVSPGDLDE